LLLGAEPWALALTGTIRAPPSRAAAPIPIKMLAVFRITPPRFDGSGLRYPVVRVTWLSSQPGLGCSGSAASISNRITADRVYDALSLRIIPACRPRSDSNGQKVLGMATSLTHP
jgi:hypothetical protein